MGERRPPSGWLSQGTLPCVWPLGCAGPQVRWEHPRSRSPGLGAKTRVRECRAWLFGIFQDWSATHVNVPQIPLGRSKGISHQQRIPRAVSIEATGRSFSSESAASPSGLTAPEPGTQATQRGLLRGVPAAALSPAAVFAEYQDTLQSPASWD